MIEKIPLLIPVVLSMVLTLAAAKSVETLAPLELLPLYNRLTGVAVAYAHISTNFSGRITWRCSIPIRAVADADRHPLCF